MIKKMLILSVWSLLFTINVFANNGVPVVVTQVLQGDTLVVSAQGNLGGMGTGYVVHLAGVDAPPTSMTGGPQSVQFLTNLTLNQYAVIIIVASGNNNHVIARMNLGRNGEGKDVGAEVIKNGWGFYRSDDNNGLSAVQQGGYNTLQSSAKYHRTGIWASGQNEYQMTPDSFRNLNLFLYTQQYVNGANDPTQSATNFNRPTQGGTIAAGSPQSLVSQPGSTPSSVPQPVHQQHQSTKPGDWRNYSY
jgi:endonuclease YncB( thermonuclease family)